MSKRLSNDELEAIRERVEEATKGPWETEITYDGVITNFEVVFSSDSYAKIKCDSIIDALANAEFIAHAREDVPKLLAEIERLRHDNDRLEYFLQEIDTHIRSTPESLPYIIGTMRRFWDYREGIEGEHPSDMDKAGVSISGFKTVWIEAGDSE